MSKQYSEGFKARVRAEYGSAIDDHLERGSQFVGRYLDDNRYIDGSPEKLLEMQRNGTLTEYLERQKRRGDLYADCFKEEPFDSYPIRIVVCEPGTTHDSRHI